jgi:hypothetical protein
MLYIQTIIHCIKKAKTIKFNDFGKIYLYKIIEIIVPIKNCIGNKIDLPRNPRNKSKFTDENNTTIVDPIAKNILFV